MTDASQKTGIGDLVTVQMQDGQDSTVINRIQKFIRVPGGSQRARLRLAVAYHRRNNQIGVIKGCPIGMGQRIAKFTALMNRAWSLGGHMAWDPSRKGELFEQPLH